MTLLRTIALCLKGNVKFYHESKNLKFTMEDGKEFSVFRHVKIIDKKLKEPQAAFIVRFKPAKMGIKTNILFSNIPMLVLLGFKGFRQKYWCVNYDSGLCQGIYEWQTLEDAESYAKSIAMSFMSKRSMPETVEFKIIDQSPNKYFVFADHEQDSSEIDFEDK